MKLQDSDDVLLNLQRLKHFDKELAIFNNFEDASRVAVRVSCETRDETDSLKEKHFALEKPENFEIFGDHLCIATIHVKQGAGLMRES